MKRLLRIAVPICVLLGVALLATVSLAAPSSAATPSSRTAATSSTAASTSPATCNPERVHTSKYAGASVGGSDFVRCAVALKPPHSKSASASVGKSAGAAASDPGTADDKFDFCNTTGGIIACFNAMLHFDSSTEFTLYDIELSDDLNDGRSVYADVDTQAVDFGYFSNTGGPGTEVYDSSGYDFTDSFDGVQYVYIDLYACGSIFSGCSSDTYSTVQSDPDFTASTSAAVSAAASASPTRANPGTVAAPKANWKVWSMTTAGRNQVGLDAEASKVHQLITADHLTGYAGLVVHPSSDNLTVYWNGQMPAALNLRHSTHLAI